MEKIYTRATIDKIYDIFKNMSKQNNGLKFYHYTSMSGVTGIFKNYIEHINKLGYSEEINYLNKCNLRASNIRYLNDSREYKEGLDSYEKIMKENGYDIKTEDGNLEPDLYSISFCSEKDLLTQWNMYGGASGIAIGFDFCTSKFSYFTNKIKDNRISFYYNYILPVAVKYIDEDRQEFFNRLSDEIENDISAEYKNYLIKGLFVPFCKNAAFQSESESRFVFYATNTNERYYDINYIVDEKKGTVKPTLNVVFECESNQNLVKEFVVGPGYNQNLVFNALIHIFDRNVRCFTSENQDKYECLNGIKIIKSKIPFRG